MHKAMCCLQETNLKHKNKRMENIVSCHAGVAVLRPDNTGF